MLEPSTFKAQLQPAGNTQQNNKHSYTPAQAGSIRQICYMLHTVTVTHFMSTSTTCRCCHSTDRYTNSHTCLEHALSCRKQPALLCSAQLYALIRIIFLSQACTTSIYRRQQSLGRAVSTINTIYTTPPPQGPCRNTNAGVSSRKQYYNIQQQHTRFAHNYNLMVWLPQSLLLSCW